jgi:hypothetical protein
MSRWKGIVLQVPLKKNETVKPVLEIVARASAAEKELNNMQDDTAYD